jgi:radical SAM superfamily enzyme YgiQ (UPF0313 family)
MLYLASYLQSQGIEVQVVDSAVKGHSLSEILTIIRDVNPSLLCMSIMTPQALPCLKISEALRARNEQTKIVVGGPHISSTFDELLQVTDAIDFAVYQEGELTLHELCRTVADRGVLADIAGLIYRADGEVIVNPPRGHIQDLDRLPFPDLAMVDVEDYDSYYARTLPLTSMITSRGCPYSCSFCDQYATHGRKLRLRGVANVVDEIAHNRDRFGISQIVFKDSTFTVNRAWVQELCGEIIARKIAIDWVCNTRADLVDKETIEIMKKAGCYMIQMGIESGSQEILKNIDKQLEIDDVIRAVNQCKRAGIEICGYFMIGNPGETRDTALETIRFARSLELDYALFSMTIAYPNTEVYRWAVEHGALTDPQWYLRPTGRASRGVRSLLGNVDLEGLPVSEQLRMVKRADRAFYLRPSYILRRMASMRSWAQLRRTLVSVREVVLGD